MLRIMILVIGLLSTPALAYAQDMCSQVRQPVVVDGRTVLFNYPPGPIVAHYAQIAVNQGRPDVAECVLVTANARVEAYIASACALGRSDETLINNITAILAEVCF